MKATDIIDTLYMKKTASTAWKRFVDQAADAKTLRQRAGHLLRDSAVHAGHPFRGTDFPEDIITAEKPLLELKQEAKDYIGSRYQLERDRGVRRFSKSHSIAFDRRRMKQPVDPDSEEFVPIINGSEQSRIRDFLRGGNGAYTTDVRMNVNDNPTSQGIMVHSANGDRAAAYAYRTSGYRGGVPAITTGKIQKKYLYGNNDYSGGGDEFAIPREHYDKIVDSKTITPESLEWPDSKKQTMIGLAGTLPANYSHGRQSLYSKLRGI